MNTVELKRPRVMEDGMETSEEMPATGEKSCHVADPHLAFFAVEEIAAEHAEWRGPGMQAHRGAANTPPL